MFSQLIEKFLGKKPIPPPAPNPNTNSNLSVSSTKRVTSSLNTTNVTPTNSTSHSSSNKLAKDKGLPTFDIDEFEKILETRQTKSGKKEKAVENLNKEKILAPSSNTNSFFLFISQELLDLIPDTIAVKYEVMPISQEDKTIHLYFADDLNKETAEKLLRTQLPGYKFNWQEFPREDLLKLIKQNYVNANAVQEKSVKAVEDNINVVKKEFIDKRHAPITFDFAGRVSGEENNHVLNTIGSFFYQGIKEGATDIDFDNPQTRMPGGRIKSEIRVSIRKDNDVKTIYQKELPRSGYNAFPAVMKHISGINSLNHNIPECGTAPINVRIENENVPLELRCEFMPCGERQGISVSVRIQKPFDFDFNLHSLGILDSQIPIIVKYAINAKNGLVALTGAMNKGKTCTLISLLKEAKRLHPNKNFALFEDNSEVSVPELRQAELVHNGNYEELIKHMLRFNCDAIAIGETRDKNVIRATIEIATTGTPCFSTIHANSAYELPERLLHLGVPRYEIANLVKLSICQILVKKNCENCVRIEDESSNLVENFGDYLEVLGYAPNTKLYCASGKMADGSICQECLGSGFRGRTGVFEVLPMSEKIRELILEQHGTSPLKIKLQAIKEGFISLWMAGLTKCLNGETTISEILNRVDLPTLESEGIMPSTVKEIDEYDFDMSN